MKKLFIIRVEMTYKTTLYILIQFCDIHLDFGL
jgi:hypothetical protein